MSAMRDVDTTVYRLAPAARCEQCEWLPLLEEPHLAARRHTAATDHQTVVERVVVRFYSTARRP